MCVYVLSRYLAPVVEIMSILCEMYLRWKYIWKNYVRNDEKPRSHSHGVTGNVASILSNIWIFQVISLFDQFWEGRAAILYSIHHPTCRHAYYFPLIFLPCTHLIWHSMCSVMLLIPDKNFKIQKFETVKSSKIQVLHVKSLLWLFFK